MKPLTAIYFIVCLLLMTAEYTGESVSTMIAYTALSERTYITQRDLLINI